MTRVPTAYIAFDLDGTLLDPDSTVSERTERGLVALRERGIRLFIATGRSPFALGRLELGPRLLELFEPMMVLRDGDVIQDRSTQSAVLARYLPAGVVPDLVERYNHVVCEYLDEVVATTRTAAVRYALFYGFPRSAIRVDPRPSKTQACKVVVFGKTPVESGPAPVRGAQYRPSPETNRLVATPTASCKAAGLHYLLDRYYDKQEFSAVMAVGDGANDECLLGAVEHGIAVVDAVPATAGLATLSLRVPLAEFLEEFTGRSTWSLRTRRACPHRDAWAQAHDQPA